MKVKFSICIFATLLAILYSISSLAVAFECTQCSGITNKIDSSSREAIPLEPVKAIVNAFRSHNLVAITEGTTHGDEQFHAFLRSLISDPRFTNTVRFLQSGLRLNFLETSQCGHGSDLLA